MIFSFNLFYLYGLSCAHYDDFKVNSRVEFLCEFWIWDFFELFCSEKQLSHQASCKAFVPSSMLLAGVHVYFWCAALGL